MKRKISNKFVIMGIFAFLLIIVGTYAMFTWRGSATTDVSVSVDGVKVLYVKGPDIIDVQLVPTFTKEEGIVKEIKISLDKVPQNAVTLNFYLDIIDIAEELKHETFKWELYKNGNLLNSNNFSLVSTGNALTLTTNQTVTTTKDKYKLYIWIDANADNPYSMGGKAFSFKLRASGNNAMYEEACSIKPIKPDTVSNAPKLASNMIPVRYDECEGVWIKANPTSDWYNYMDKKWANAVTVTAASRTKYLNASAGEPVLEDDVLTYLVWIPRYKYQLFNSGNGTSVPVQEINVEFESGTSTTGTVSCTVASNGVETCMNDVNGNWYTHPAFKFGEDELTGLWVGKFETSHVTLSSSSTENNLGCTNTNCANADGLKIKPNIQSLRYNDVSNMFYASRSMNRSGNVYGFNTSEVDSHMMKNIEWGAVAYLTQSEYGRCISGTCTEISLNNSSNFYAGRSMGVPGGSGIKTPTNEYKTQGYYTYDGKCATIHENLPAPCNAGNTGQELTDKILAYSASTTGNIYGIYDMSGGSFEFVMGNMVNSSGAFQTSSSGFNGGSVANPESKYYDRYKYDETNSVTQNRGHLGDATRETLETYGVNVGSWYNDYAYFVHSNFPWFFRSGTYSGGVNAGSFYYNYSYGNMFSIYYSWRLTIQAK